MTRPLGLPGSLLGIDFGTTHTVAALAGGDGRPQPLLFDASFLLPSAVYADPGGRVLVGQDAMRGARLDPTRFEPNPKRRIDDGSVLLGSREYPVAELIGAVLRRVGDEAARVAGAIPAATVLTYPAAWAASRKNVLASAAASAGLPAVTVIPEPLAAAVYFTTVLGHGIAPGGVLLVYDFGGGTLDISILRRTVDGGWAILATDGLDDVGGVDLDGAIVEQLGRTLGAQDPERWSQLVNPEGDAARRRHRMLWDDARSAKEQLSRSSSAAVHVPLFDTDVPVTREEFERVARPYVERTVDLTVATLQRAGIRADQVTGVFPVGGSSRIPLAATMLHHRLAIAPTIIDQPELVVALGSFLAVPGGHPARFAGSPGAGGSGSGSTPAVVSANPVSPVIAPSTPVSAAPTSPPSASAPSPVSAHPAPAPVSSVTPGAPGVAGEPGSARPGQPVWPAASPSGPPPAPRSRGGKKPLLIVAFVVVVLLGTCGICGTKFWKVLSNARVAGNEAAASARASASASNAGAADDGAKQSVRIGKTAWYAGFKIEFGDATYDPKADPSAKNLSVNAVVENLGTGNVQLNLPIAFSGGGVQAEGTVRDYPTITGKNKADVVFDFSLERSPGTIAGGVLTLGEADVAQSIVPMGEGNLHANEPREILGGKSVTVRDLSVKYNKCELRADFTVDHSQAPAGRTGVVCSVDIQYTGDSSHYVGDANFRLKLPDGKVIGPKHGPNESMSGKELAPDAFLGFHIRWPAPGGYALQLVDFHTEGEVVSAENTVEVPFALS